MKKSNKMITILMTMGMIAAVVTGCGQASVQDTTSVEETDTLTGQQETELVESDNMDVEEKIKVVATIFPEYDFLRQIGGDQIQLTMLMKPGAEAHSFEPTPQDMKEIIQSDMFVYVGGDSDFWVADILDSIDTSHTQIVTLMDSVDTIEEETVEGMTPETEEEGETEGVEYDEHVWTSPKNAELICQKLSDILCQIDPDNSSFYQKNTTEYMQKLDKLDQDFRDVVTNASRDEIIVGDRFPFRYLVEEYGLTYYAAFPGCASETQPSAATIAFLVDKVKEDNIPVVFHIELSNEQVADAICEQTGAKNELLNAVHNVTKDDFESGVTYIDLMEHNVEVLKEALN